MVKTEIFLRVGRRVEGGEARFETAPRNVINLHQFETFARAV